jgi:hypothetical protein
MNASDEVKDMLISIIKEQREGRDIFDIILEINDVINNIAETIPDPDIQFERKFQLIADLNFAGRFLDNVLAELTTQDMTEILKRDPSDPFLRVMEYLK